ncbi:MAG: Nif3-like dinuclear metal center hexameric protein [Oligoflexia bacterium]
MQLLIREIVGEISWLAPESTAERWDNVGLLSGDPDWKTSGVVVSIDLTREAIQAARKKGYRLIVNHHPCIFLAGRNSGLGLSRITPPSLVFEALQAGIAVAACHTNFDRCALEVPHAVSRLLGASMVGRLIEEPSGSLKKLVVFVPQSHTDELHAALSGAGAGHVGRYDQCAFIGDGQGRFRGGQGTEPYYGKPGKLERTVEDRLETIFPAGLEGEILQALRDAHPYQEIAYDIYPVDQVPSREGVVRGLGYGFFGDFRKPQSLERFTRKVVQTFGASGALVTPSGQLNGAKTRAHQVSRMGYVPGKGSSFIGAALKVGCDVLVTGETGYHDALKAARHGMTVIELGHRESERFFLSTMAGWMESLGLKTLELNTPQQVMAGRGQLR